MGSRAKMKEGARMTFLQGGPKFEVTPLPTCTRDS